MNIEKLRELSYFNCSHNQVSELKINKNAWIEDYFDCSYNQLTELELTNRYIFMLSCSNNKLTKLDISPITDIEYLWCYNNQLTELDLSGTLDFLMELDCRGNNISLLDLTGVRNMNKYRLQCDSNVEVIGFDK